MVSGLASYTTAIFFSVFGSKLTQSPTHAPQTGFSNDSLLSLRSALADIGFETYSTSVGGRGYGVLVPPAAGSAEEQVESAEGGVEANAIPGRKRFEDAPAEDLARWAESAGVWTCA